MCEVFSFPVSSTAADLSYNEVVQLSNMAGLGLPTNLLFCKACQTIFKDPKLLPCLHTYCRACLERQVQEQENIVCSLCGYFMSPPTGGINSLTNNVFSERVVKQYVNKIQEFANIEIDNINNGNTTHSEQQLVNTLMEKAKYSPASLSMYLLQKRDNSCSFQYKDTNMVSTSADGNENFSPAISKQPDLVQSHTSAEDSLQNMVDKLSSNIDHKLMTFQGEALRVTYAIDSINQSVNDWREKRYQLKRKVEERSNILQHQIRRHEKRLIAEIDSRYYEDKMMKDAEKSKHTLRQNLKGILQTVEFLKQIQDYATEDEILALKERLTACSLNTSEVKIKWQEFQMDTPSESPDVLMASNFGQLQTCERSSVVFIPGSLELERDIETEENAASLNDSMFTDRMFSYSRSPPLSRRVSRLSSRNSQTDNETEGSSASVTLDQFRNMRESFKQRRRELLEGHSSDSRDFICLTDSMAGPTVSQKRRVRSFGGRTRPASTYIVGHQDILHEPRLLDAIRPLPVNATSRDITERNEISGQMAHLSHEDREDKIKRMQNLRESWKRRKEILMKNDGYISPNSKSTFEYDVTDDEISEEPQQTVKQSRMKQIKNRFSQMRQHFRNEVPAEAIKTEVQPTEGVVLRNKPQKEKKEKRWSGIFKSKRKSLSSSASTEFVLEDTDGNDEIQKSDVEAEDQRNDKTNKEKGLTRTKLQQIRTSVRKKTQRWRSFSSN